MTSLRSRPPPEGWVYFARSPKYTKTTFTEGYLNSRMSRTNTIAMNQHYVERIMENPRTSYWNRMAVAEYVISHPERFTPLSDMTDDPELNEFARRRTATPAATSWRSSGGATSSADALAYS
ncbi:MAG: hypothetical protein J5485_04940 [Candidatus Methanomethylophilaceae archaeon]|nr:hypothetical protein [Candidatus Methanomethylophilaceae archaeon]